MSSLLTDNRVRIAILPPELIVEAVVDEQVDIDDLIAGRDGDTVLFHPGIGARVLASAYARWVRLAVTVPRLPFNLQYQPVGRDNWCWAAVIASLLEYYCPPTPRKQCAVVDDNLRTHCCAGDLPSTCDKAYPLVDALTKATMLFSQSAGPVPISSVMNEIDHRFPICLRIQWDDTQLGHFIVIDGYLQLATGDLVGISDPWYGPTQVSLKDLTDGKYQRGTHPGAEWTDTYGTQGPVSCQRAMLETCG